MAECVLSITRYFQNITGFVPDDGDGDANDDGDKDDDDASSGKTI